MSKLENLAGLGQSIWFDYIRRSLLTSGELEELIKNGVRGVTSNPAIFENAIAGSTDYDEDLKQLVKEDKSVNQIYESLAMKDIALAANLLNPVYQSTSFKDGFVSFEVDPLLAKDTEKTISEAERLFTTLNKPNVMIKVPATMEGIPAVEKLIAAGVNVNVTLIFGIDNYENVAEAYISGLEKLAQNGPTMPGGLDVDKIASVASFFVSRVDTYVDQALEKLGNTDLIGKIAVFNAKVAYQKYEKIFSGKRWDHLAEKGARVQRLLWASTGTKNPLYADTLYVDELIGPDTVNTIPPKTLDAFLDHGIVLETLTKGVGQAVGGLDQLGKTGIDLNTVTQKLQDDGVDAFVKPFELLMKSIADKKAKIIEGS